MNKSTVLVDTDFHRYADDHEALRILAPGHRAGVLTIAGVTTVTGNAWASVCAEHATQAVIDLALGSVPVFQGAGQPLLHRQSDFAHRSRLYGAAFGGAWGNAELLESSPVSQPRSEHGAGVHAVEHIIQTLRNADHQVAILALGPLTNLALAIRLAPDVVCKIGQLVVMGGAFFVAGNVTPSAEFNWWFDPEAAAIVLEQKIEITVVPLDATDVVEFDYKRFKRWQSLYGNHPFFRAFHEPKFSKPFENDSAFKLPVWDALAAACLVDESLIASSQELWVTVDCSNGPSYGRVVAFGESKAFNLDDPERPKARVVTKVDESRFWAMYESLVFAD